MMKSLLLSLILLANTAHLHAESPRLGQRRDDSQSTPPPPEPPPPPPVYVPFVPKAPVKEESDPVKLYLPGILYNHSGMSGERAVEIMDGHSKYIRGHRVDFAPDTVYTAYSLNNENTAYYVTLKNHSYEELILSINGNYYVAKNGTYISSVTSKDIRTFQTYLGEDNVKVYHRKRPETTFELKMESLEKVDKLGLPIRVKCTLQNTGAAPGMISAVVSDTRTYRSLFAVEQVQVDASTSPLLAEITHDNNDYPKVGPFLIEPGNSRKFTAEFTNYFRFSTVGTYYFKGTYQLQYWKDIPTERHNRNFLVWEDKVEAPVTITVR